MDVRSQGVDGQAPAGGQDLNAVGFPVALWAGAAEV